MTSRLHIKTKSKKKTKQKKQRTQEEKQKENILSLKKSWRTRNAHKSSLTIIDEGACAPVCSNEVNASHPYIQLTKWSHAVDLKKKAAHIQNCQPWAYKHYASFSNMQACMYDIRTPMIYVRTRICINTHIYL